MNNRFIKLIILIVIIIILCIVGLLYLLNDKKNDVLSYNNVNVDENNNNVIENDIVLDTIDAENFYTVSNCVQLYLDAINKNNSNYYTVNDNGEYHSDIELEEVKESIYNLLSDEYVNENNISVDNVWDNVPEVNEKLIFIPLDMKVFDGKNIDKYIVYGDSISLEYNLIKKFYLIVNIDNNNNTFSVEPINENISNINEINTYNNNESYIKINNDNSIIAQNIDERYLSLHYFNNFKRLMLCDIRESYAYFDKNYAEKRFVNLENFTNYVTKNREEIIGLRCEKFLVNNKEGYTEYIIQDQYENLYIFDSKSIMDYTLKLDTYTISTEKFSTTYASSSGEKKVQMNIDKFFQMINRHDYRTSYSYLATSFKNNYSLTEDKFEEISKDKFFTYNNVEYVKYKEVGNNTFAYEIKLTDLTGNNSEEKIITIIMQLNEGEDFEMSFDIE